VNRLTRALAVVALTCVLVPGIARAAGPIVRGTTDLGLGGAVSFTHQIHHEATESVTAYQLLAHAGYVATDPMGPGWLSGNLELLLEPQILYLDGDKGRSATVGGAAALARWLFVGTGTVRPFVEGGVGLLGGKMEFRQTNCDVNYVIEGGPGVLVFVSDRVAVSAAYRFQHISNAGGCSKNLGLNSSAVMVGVSYFFP